MKGEFKSGLCAAVLGIVCGGGAAMGQVDPVLAAWEQNLTGQHGRSTSPTLNGPLSLIIANVQQVRYTDANSYINATGIPDYNIGPWPSNPNTATNQNTLARFPRAPQVQTGTKTATGLGAIGLMVDGTQIFNATDARSYQNRNVWHQDAVVVEGASFDSALGHPSPMNAYHYHGQPRTLRSEMGDDGSHHSPILGYAFDGFPIYGPYGYANANGTGAITRMTSGYRKRSITTRTTLPNGTVLAAANYGPAVSTQYPLGYYLQDYEFVAGMGTLDVYNGRVCVTPDYPTGTFAYFVTIDAAGNSQFPYILALSYYGVVAADNTSRTVTVPPGANRYLPCAADYNGDGGIDGGDIEPFFDDWSEGLNRADVNDDGGIDGSDVEEFFRVWTAGGC